MRKYASLLSLITAVLVLIIFCLWYTAPRTAEQLFPGFQWSNAVSISGSYTQYDGATQPAFGSTEALSPGDPSFDTLRELARQLRYRRSLWNLLPLGSHAHQAETGSYVAAVRVETGQNTLVIALLPQGVNVGYGGQGYRCSTAQQAAASTLLTFLRENASEG